MIINSRIADNEIVDVNQSYDTRFFRNETFPDGTIPVGAPLGNFRRTPGGVIQPLNQNELDDKFPVKKAKADILALKASLQTDIAALPGGPQKQILADMLKLIIALAKAARAE
jgi:hypothetical protein